MKNILFAIAHFPCGFKKRIKISNIIGYRHLGLRPILINIVSKITNYTLVFYNKIENEEQYVKEWIFIRLFNCVDANGIITYNNRYVS